MSHILIEAAIDSIASAERAVAEGADRLEVCANLEVGGLTPPMALLRRCLTLGVPCVAMARPRAGDFVYAASEVASIQAAVGGMCGAGAAGVVFGILRHDGSVDARATRGVVLVAGTKETVFHRAFDLTPDATLALEALIECGVTRVLTSGKSHEASAGASTLQALVRQAAGRVQIIAGGGVRAHNVLQLVRLSGVTQVHARGTEPGTIAAIRAALSAP